jgi:hypothetical protein
MCRGAGVQGVQMQPAKRFEELVFWQQARELTRLIYALTQKDGFVKDYVTTSSTFVTPTCVTP